MENDQASNGKGKSIELDVPFLRSSHDNKPTIPRNTSMDYLSNFAQALSPTVEQSYTYSSHYLHDNNRPGHVEYSESWSHSPGRMTGFAHQNNASFATEPGAGEYSDADWDTMSCGSTSTTMTAQQSIFSSDTMSTSDASSVPSRHSRVSNVDTHINRQAPPRQRYQLPCEFRCFGCDKVFNGDENFEWKTHTEDHLGGSFPSKLRCWFCDEFGFFDAKTSGGDNRFNFERRMDHIRDHILMGEFRIQDRRPDGYLANHLKKHGLIDEQGYQNMLKPVRVPAAPGASRRHHPRRSARQLTAVQEEAGPISSSSLNHRRSGRSSDKGREHTRESHHQTRPAK